MELLDVMKQRHSVRRYTDKVIEKDIRTESDTLEETIVTTGQIGHGMDAKAIWIGKPIKLKA